MNKKGMEMWWLVAMIAAILILFVVIGIIKGQAGGNSDLLGSLFEKLQFGR